MAESDFRDIKDGEKRTFGFLQLDIVDSSNLKGANVLVQNTKTALRDFVIELIEKGYKAKKLQWAGDGGSFVFLIEDAMIDYDKVAIAACHVLRMLPIFNRVDNQLDIDISLRISCHVGSANYYKEAEAMHGQSLNIFLKHEREFGEPNCVTITGELYNELIRPQLKTLFANNVRQVCIRDKYSGLLYQVSSADLETRPQLLVRMDPTQIVNLIFEAAKTNKFGENLFEDSFPEFKNDGQSTESLPFNEGVILVKPGGTFNQPCLKDIFSRIIQKCTVHKIRVFDGDMIKKRNLFDTQYESATKIATGETSLTPKDYHAIANIYNKPEFERAYGVKYSDDLVVPSLKLCEPPYNLTADEITRKWEEGRKSNFFWSNQWNGLNKIGFQKSVFPITFDKLSGTKVRIVLNGYIPGYRALFTSTDARIIAVHVSTKDTWKNIRDKVVGGKSNPAECLPGTIRRDAFDGKIPLDSQDNIVNGQRNVCHCSATLFDGMRELMIWFDYPIHQTLLGKLLQKNGIQLCNVSKETIDSILNDISWTTRDNTIEQELFEVYMHIVQDNLRGEEARQEKMKRFAAETNVPLAAIQNCKDLVEFVHNARRFSVARENFYCTILCRMFASQDEKDKFREVAEEIRKLASNESQKILPEVLAEAYRIAASDLRFLQCTAYDKIARPQHFHSMVFADLAREAIACAKRLRSNLINDILTLKDHPLPGSVEEMQKTTEWKDFLRNRPKNLDSERAKPEILAIILAGGRSTRMCSTIPKPMLPFREQVMLNVVLDILKQATDSKGSYYVATGFRSQLVQYALDNDSVHFIEYEKTLGLAFRAAICLESLEKWNEVPVILMYTDMPLVSPNKCKELIEQVRSSGDKRTFGIMTSQATYLSGHIKRESGKIERVIQQRLHPDLCWQGMERDMGVYVFHNSLEFRSVLMTLENNNVRREFIFADVVEMLVKKGWKIVSQEEEEPDRARGINFARDLLFLASGVYHSRATKSEVWRVAQNYYNLVLPEQWDVTTFRDTIQAHIGPLYCFPWWDQLWSKR